MSTAELSLKSALELGAMIRAREISPTELARFFFATIGKFNEDINAVVAIDPELTFQQTAEVEKKILAGELADSPLAGVPFLAKDLDVTAGMRTTFGSRIHPTYVPTWDMLHIARLKAAGCILLGKTNTPEDGTIPNTYNDLFGATRNPWNRELCAGGSSGGSAAAIATGFAPLATGSDGAGSIRLPASICGVFGIKPTFGLIPFGPKGIGVMNTIGHLGPITRHAADAAAMLDIMSGPDERDRGSIPKTSNLLAKTQERFAPRRIAYSPDLGYASVEPGARELFLKAIENLKYLGWPLVEASPGFDPPQRAIDVLVAFEWGTVPMQMEKKNPEAYELQTDYVKQLAEFRKSLTIEDLWQAYETRKNICVAMGKFFETYELLLTPTLTRGAFELDRPWPSKKEAPDEEDRSLNSMLYPFNLTGDPACSVPMGLMPNGLPIGMQIIGPRHRDDLVLRAVHSLGLRQDVTETNGKSAKQ